MVRATCRGQVIFLENFVDELRHKFLSNRN